ncbi:hypothetical protein NKG94_44235 [Micromonospora sp. M12]
MHTHVVPKVAGPRRGVRRVRLAVVAGRLRTRRHDHGGETEFRPVGAECWDASRRLADMDADGVDVQVVSPTPVFFSYDRPADQAVKVARIFNDLTLEVTAAGGDRLVPFCQVPFRTRTPPAPSWIAASPPGTWAWRSATTSATGTWTTRAWSPSSSTVPRWAHPSSSTRGTCRAVRDSTAGWLGGSPGCPPRRTCRCWR